MEALSKIKLQRKGLDWIELNLTETAVKDLYNDGLLRINADGSGDLNQKGETLLFEKCGVMRSRSHFDKSGSSFGVEDTRLIGEKVVEITGIAMNGDATQAEVEYKTEYVFADRLKPISKYVNKSAGTHSAVMRKYDDGWRVTSY